MSDRAPCVRCGMMLHTGEGRVTVAFTAAELIDLAWDVHNRDARDPTVAKLIDRLLCAAGLLDAEREGTVRQQIAECRRPL